MPQQQKYSHQGNRALYDAMFDKRSSGATMKHKDRRTRRKRTRAASRQAAIRFSE